MVEVGNLFKLKADVRLSTYYKVDYVIVVKIESNHIDYKDIQNMDIKYSAQVCDFLTMFDLWEESDV